MSNAKWSFPGQTVVVTGASRGIGLAAANLFAAAGAEVYALSRSKPTDGFHGNVRLLSCDVAAADEIAEAIGQAAAVSGRIDICVANAAVWKVEDYAHADPAEWGHIVDVNLLGVMGAWQAALRYMDRDGRGGRLIATSSVSGVRGALWNAAYSASKAALGGLVQALAIEYAERGISVNAVAPGETDTKMGRESIAAVAAREGRSGEEFMREVVSDHIPTRRVGRPEDIAALIAFLASDEAAYITGRTIVIDGGMLLV